MVEHIERKIHELKDMAEVICGEFGSVKPEWHDHAGYMMRVSTFRDENFDINLIFPNGDFEIKYRGESIVDTHYRGECLVNYEQYVQQGIWQPEYERLYAQAHTIMQRHNEELKRKAGMFASLLPVYTPLPTPN